MSSPLQLTPIFPTCNDPTIIRKAKSFLLVRRRLAVHHPGFRQDAALVLVPDLLHIAIGLLPVPFPMVNSVPVHVIPGRLQQCSFGDVSLILNGLCDPECQVMQCLGYHHRNLSAIQKELIGRILSATEDDRSLADASQTGRLPLSSHTLFCLLQNLFRISGDIKDVLHPLSLLFGTLVYRPEVFHDAAV